VNSVVLDASAILAVVHGEKGYEKVVPHLESGLTSAVNYAEVRKKAVERGTDLLTTRQLLQNFAIVILPFDNRQAVETARLWPHVRSLGLSFAGIGPAWRSASCARCRCLLLMRRFAKLIYR
jgi:PIN domain nuclease of toxin-antitoxin system